MTPRSHFSLSFCAAACLGAGTFLTLTASLQAQGAPATTTEVQTAPVPADAFSFEIGHAAKAGAIYTVNATQPATSKLTGQKIRLKIVEQAGTGTTTSFYTLATGRYKTVAQLDAGLVDIFRGFLSDPVAGNLIGKIGDLKHGGEVRFVVISADSLRFDSLSPTEPVRSTNYSRTEIEGLLTALSPAPM